MVAGNVSGGVFVVRTRFMLLNVIHNFIANQIKQTIFKGGFGVGTTKYIDIEIGVSCPAGKCVIRIIRHASPFRHKPDKRYWRVSIFEMGIIKGDTVSPVHDRYRLM